MKEINIEKIENTFRNRKPKTVGIHRFYSILIPIVKKDGVLNLLYEVRAKDLARQPGEICFPGGAMEKNETPLQCAVRETCEEIGVKKEDIKIINKGDTVHTQSNFSIYSYIGILDITNMKINEEEVESIFLVPIKFLIENPPEVYPFEMIPEVGDDFPYDKVNAEKGYKWRKAQSEVPIYQYEDKAIWGLTGRITQNFIKILEESR